MRFDFLHSRLIRRIGPDLVRVLLPTEGMNPISEASDLTMEFSVTLPEINQLRFECEGKDLILTADKMKLVTQIPAGIFDPTLPYQSCKLIIYDETFGQKIRSDEIKLSLNSDVN